jgi:putative lipoprotein
MRRLSLIFLFPILLYGQVKTDSSALTKQTQANRDLWFAKDKADHLVSSAFLVGLGYYMSRQEMNRSHAKAGTMALEFSFSLGIAKEVYDGTIRKDKPSAKDLVADIIGSGLGYAIISLGKK